MKRILMVSVGVLIITLLACNQNEFDSEVVIPDFNFPHTIVFEDSLSAYNIFKGTPSNLTPSDSFQLLELNSVLFTDYAYKQRLVKVPEGTKMTKMNDGSINFPNGTILTKTFYYYKDERDTMLGKRIIETRLMIKENSIWNIATYIWNETQDDAKLELEGQDTYVSWINLSGNNISTLYHIPDENECIACHQSNSEMIPLGTKLRNLNRSITSNGVSVNQITYLQSVGFLNDFQEDGIPKIVNYMDESNSLSERARAYMDINCSHCHNPSGWEESSEIDFDFRYETQLSQTGIKFESDRIEEALLDREMPFIGTTVMDEEGVDLIIDFIENL